MPRGDNEEPGRPEDLPTRNLPEEWLGVYKTLADVPAKYRLSNFEAELDDPFADYLETKSDLSEWTLEHKHGKAYRDFAEFMGERGRHPACPTPDDVYEFFVDVKAGRWANVDERSLRTVHATYLAPLKTAFKWFVHRVDYPHVYNPLLMAATRDGPLRDAWLDKVASGEDRWERRKNGEKPRDTNND